MDCRIVSILFGTCTLIQQNSTLLKLVNIFAHIYYYDCIKFLFITSFRIMTLSCSTNFPHFSRWNHIFHLSECCQLKECYAANNKSIGHWAVVVDGVAQRTGQKRRSKNPRSGHFQTYRIAWFPWNHNLAAWRHIPIVIYLGSLTLWEIYKMQSIDPPDGGASRRQNRSLTLIGISFLRVWMYVEII